MGIVVKCNMYFVNLIYKKLFRPLLFRLDAERAHDLASQLLSITESSNISRKFIQFLSSKNSSDIDLFGLSFPNHLGLGAGMDKNGSFPKSFASLGFGHVEIGTITPLAQSGNPKPRLFRYPKYNALVNRMGFNNDGADVIIDRIKQIYPKGERSVPLGINIGKGKNTPIDKAHEDYIYCLNQSFLQADYITVNISSPNTPNLRDLHKMDLIAPLLKILVNTNQSCAKKYKTLPVPLILKISPDESYKSLENIICNARECGFSGVIATNTTISRFGKMQLDSMENGGLSGDPLESKSNAIIKFLAKLTNYNFPIIGAGGISSYDAAIRKLDAGASLLQIYSSLVYNGPFFPSRLSDSIRHRRKSWV